MIIMLISRRTDFHWSSYSLNLYHSITFSWTTSRKGSTTTISRL